MRLPLGLLLLLASCARAAAPSTPPTNPSDEAEAQPTAPPPIRGTATGIQTGVGDPDAPDLEVSVSFVNDGDDTCEVTAFSLAWDRSAEAARQACSAGVTLGPGGTAEATCLVPFTSPMRNPLPDYADTMEVVDIVATCPASQ